MLIKMFLELQIAKPVVDLQLQKPEHTEMIHSAIAKRVDDDITSLNKSIY